MGIGGIAIFDPLLRSLQNLSCYCTRIRRRGAELRQHDVAPGQHAIQYPHPLSFRLQRQRMGVRGFQDLAARERERERERWVWKTGGINIEHVQVPCGRWIRAPFQEGQGGFSCTQIS